MATFTTEEHIVKGRGDVRDFIFFSEDNLNAQSPTPEEYFLISLAADIGLHLKKYANERNYKTGRITVKCNLIKDDEYNLWIEKRLDYEYTQEPEIDMILEEYSRKSPIALLINIPINYVNS